MKISVGKIPKFISAASPSGLQRLMLKTQVKLGYGVHFFDIQFLAESKKWFAWYYDNDDITAYNAGEKLGNEGERNS